MIPLHPEPLRNFDYKGFNYYSFTWCCDYRQPYFAQADHVELVRSQFLRASEETDIVVDAYCFMPEHVHQLVHGKTSAADAKMYIRKAKQYSGFYFSKAFGLKLWQRYGHDRVLRADHEPRVIVRYIIENPVRRGLVQKPEDYPHTGSAVHSIQELMEWAYAL